MKTIVLDTSPIIALYLAEQTAPWVDAQISTAGECLMSTINMAECLIILRQRRPDKADALKQRLIISQIQFIPPDSAKLNSLP